MNGHIVIFLSQCKQVRHVYVTIKTAKATDYLKRQFDCHSEEDVSVTQIGRRCHSLNLYTEWLVNKNDRTGRGIQTKPWYLLRKATLNRFNHTKICCGLLKTSLLNIWGLIATVPACSSGTLTNVLPHRNVMPQTQDMTPHPVTVYRHTIGPSLCFPLVWNVTLEYTTTHFNKTHTQSNDRLVDAAMVVVSQKLGRKCTVSTEFWTRDLWCANPLRYPLAHSCFLYKSTPDAHLYSECTCHPLSISVLPWLSSSCLSPSSSWQTVGSHWLCPDGINSCIRQTSYHCPGGLPVHHFPPDRSTHRRGPYLKYMLLLIHHI